VNNTLEFRIVIIGSSGRLGKELVNLLSPKCRLILIGRDQLDLLNLNSIVSTLTPINYNLLILVGAMTNVDLCENHPENARLINAISPVLISSISNQKNARVIYISTDMVFDGLSKTAYKEEDSSNPICVYGHTKREGEIAVISANPKNIVLRTSWLFGPSSDSFPTWIIQLARKCKHISLPSDKFASPTYVPDLVSWIGKLIFEHRENPPSGIYHLCNTGSCSWQEWGQSCIDAAQDAGISLISNHIESVNLKEVTELRARRPANSVLCIDKFSALSGISPQPWNEALSHYIFNNRDHFS
jgi:dTDP-4-dehydrorhamnose reductase